jgi:cellulose synthase/poly-beta-1,6-N-acetylglucosamine synthase-like glycosyltransferase
MTKKKKAKSELRDSVTSCYDYLPDYQEEVGIELLAGYDTAASKFFISKSQICGLLLIAFSILLGFIYYQEVTSISLLFTGFLLYFNLIITKHQLFFTKIVRSSRDFVKKIFQKDNNPPTTFTQPDGELPLYSILLPVFKESKDIIEQLFHALDRLHYPKHKKQILLLIEQCDQVTLEIVKTIKTNLNYQLIIVPDFFPRTKAKACNYALQFVKGDFVVIFDADDIPDPNQLLVVLDKFNTSQDGNLACLQAKLNYYNANENLLTKLFSLEYSILFDKILPGLAHRQAPLPLGGTSNHFKVEVLKSLQGWDIYNLTEDAEIGMRLSYNGYSTDLVDSYTLEEAPITIYAWLKQRSRWLKGFIQTYCLYSQKQYNLKKKIGSKKHALSVNFMLGHSTLSLLLSPIMLITGFFMKQTIQILPNIMYDFLRYFGYGTMLLWLISTCLQSHAAIKTSPFLSKNSLLDNIRSLVTFPFYFILHTCAAFYATIDLIIRPFYWNKTAHGISQKKNFDYLTDYSRKDNGKLKKDE